MSRIFEIKDRSARKIYLTSERWSHIQKHPEMSDKLEQIRETLVQPTKITKFKYDSNARFYYRYYKSIKAYLLVLVKYLNGEGFIITSFYTDRIK